ncbi:amidohydrolase family protein [Roseimaritima ulvae]|uniref:4-sulfomuconolactone hydrolase n=1 Tax=Roseimaritima ulvae TaxID=980254 RepID=A0A5B9QJJ2_9BACT|nr:amidohydrolase family protein [Roseimaritima ulvae]QEG39084.1 4-sulfomuconolactone hydrolase [Roseimaritima ulvae]
MKPFRRRDFIRGLGAVPLCTATGLAEDAPSSVVVDTHLHCFAGQNRRFPYHPRAPYRPSSAATPEHLLQCMDNAGVDFAVVVHPEPYQDDHRYLEHCLKVGQERLKGTCLFFADRPGSVEKMAPLVQRHPGRIIAARVHAYAPDRLPPFGTKELRQLWKTASDLGLAMQLHFEPRYAPGLEPLIREFKDTTVVIDHLGRPMQGTPEEHEVVVRWSRFPNTVMKVSSIPDQNRYPHRDVKPVIRRLTDAFGAERMIYGGGFNAAATGESYRDYRMHVADLLSHLSDADRRKILGGTAAKLYKFNGS